MGSGFGERLRAERLERGMTQAELGKDLYSPSYISLLETGRREPTRDVIQELARRLELAPKALEEWNNRVTQNDADYVLAALYARQAWDLRDYELAAQHAAEAARIALDAKNVSAWWNMRYMQAECLLKQGKYSECQGVVGQLVEHRLAIESAGLGVRARQMLAAVCHGQGRLADSVEHARQAVALGAQLPKDSPIYSSALRIYIGALAETGRLDEAWEQCKILSKEVSTKSVDHMSGIVAWVIGNVAFMRHDYEEGVAQHDRAAKLLSPGNDIEQWANFNKASAAMRLNSGIVEASTLAALERAELAHTIVSGTLRDGLELRFIRAKWLYLTDELPAAIEILREVVAQEDEIGMHVAAEVHLLLGKALKATDDLQEAMAYLSRAQQLFASAGASEGIQQAMDAMLEIRLAERRAKANSA